MKFSTLFLLFLSSGQFIWVSQGLDISELSGKGTPMPLSEAGYPNNLMLTEMKNTVKKIIRIRKNRNKTVKTQYDQNVVTVYDIRQ